MKKLSGIALWVAIGLLVLQGPGRAAVDGYYIGADSRQALEQAQRSNPDNYAVNYFLGQIYLAEGNRDAAIGAWQAYLAAAPRDGRSAAVSERVTVLKMEQAREFAQNTLAKGGEAIRLPANTIAVTDFKNLGSAKLVPFIKGLTAMIISDLAKVPQVRVLERAKIQALAQEMELGLTTGLVDQKSAPRLGRLLQARNVAWGEMDAPAGNNLEITSIVTEIVENTQLKQTQAKGAMSKFFELQKQLVFGILQGMDIEKSDLPDNVRKAVEKVHTTSVEALIQFGLGVDFLDNKEFGQAKQAFAKAAKIDPDFDLAATAETATPVSDVAPTSDGATEEVSMSTAGTGEEDEEGTEETPSEESGTGTTDTAATDNDADVATADDGATTSTAVLVSADTTTVTDTTTDTSQTTTTNDTSSNLWDGPGHWHAATILVVTESRWTENVYVGDSNGPNISQHNIPSINQAGKNMVFNQDTDTMVSFDTHYGTVTVNQVMTFSADGHDEWIEYGRWNLPATTFTDGTYHYAFAGPGWYVDGATFDTTALSGTGSYTYSGSAKGSLYTHSSDSVTDLSGSFSCIADFNNNEINNFEMNLNGSDVVISGGSGIFAGSGADPYGFVITPSSISVKGETPFNASVRGTVYGDTNVGGKYVGGTFGTYGSNYSTAGYFVGEQQGSVAAAAP